MIGEGFHKLVGPNPGSKRLAYVEAGRVDPLLAAQG